MGHRRKNVPYKLIKESGLKLRDRLLCITEILEVNIMFQVIFQILNYF